MNQKNDNYLSITYDLQRTPKTSYPKKLIEYLVKRFNLSATNKLLEIGCGRGDFLEEFSKLGMQVFGIDRESTSAEILSKKEIEVKNCDISKDKIPYPDNFFDVIYHKSLIEHLYDPSNLMKESYRVLKPGGKLIILTPEWVSQMKNFYEDITHCRPYDVSALKDAFLIYKFKNVTTEKFYQLPILWKIKSLKMFSFLLRHILSVHLSRNLTKITKVKFFRWSVELMVLGYGEK